MPTLTIDQALELAMQHHQAGRLAEAEGIYRQILAQQARHPDALHLLGVLVCQKGQAKAALDLINQAIAIAPREALYHANLAKALLQAGQPHEALQAQRQVLALKPDDALGHYELGGTLQILGDQEAAITAYQRALQLNPDHPQANNNLGVIFNSQRRHNEAMACFHKALRGKPDMIEACTNIGATCEARGQYEEAIRWHRQALSINPRHPGLHYNLGVALAELSRFDEALAAYRLAIELKPDYFEAHNNLGGAYKNLLRFDDAMASYREALRLRPSSAEAHTNLASTLFSVGEHEQAIPLHRKSLELNPAHAAAHSQLLYGLLFHPGYDADMLRQEHAQWNQRHAVPLHQTVQPHVNDRSRDRRLRIGYVSPDFREHVVARNLVPLLERHDRAAIEFICYSNSATHDAMTRRFRELAEKSGGWRDIVRVPDSDVADRVRADQIDILVDLTLHMYGHRLLVFARKPAPVQATFAGYPGTTGVEAIDYRLTDVHLDPPGRHDAWYSETSIHLPDTYWCFDPLGVEPEINSLPAASAQNAEITFGCLNNITKVNRESLALWAGVLKAVKPSRLILLGPQGAHRERMLESFGQLGIAPERITFLPNRPRPGYLEYYHQIDIGLDTLPYNGHSTSLDSYWMGVPVVTLVGRTVVGRAGLSQLTNLGLTELIAHTPADFVTIAANLAHDLPRLKNLRFTLRERMRNSPLMDAPRFARNIEAAYRTMWQTWCNSTPEAGGPR